MPTEILFVHARHGGTTPRPFNTVLRASSRQDFDGVRAVRLLSITASGWLLSARNSAEGGARNSTPMFGVQLTDRDEHIVGEVIGPVHQALSFTGIAQLTVWLRVAHFLLADLTYPATWTYDMGAACYYEL